MQCATDADSVRRITKRDILNSSTKIPTMAVVLGYENDAPHIGKKLNMEWLRFTVKQYKALVTYCYKCQGFMHTAEHCYKKDDICPSCAGRHKYGDCPKKEEIKKCANCGDPHSAAFRGCPKYQEVKAIIDRAILSGTSYRDALIRTRREARGDTRAHLGEEVSSTIAAIRATTETSPTRMTRPIETRLHHLLNTHQQTDHQTAASPVTSACIVASIPVT